MNSINTIKNCLNSWHLVCVDRNLEIQPVSYGNRFLRSVRSLCLGSDAVYADCKPERIAFAVQKLLSQIQLTLSAHRESIEFLNQLRNRISGPKTLDGLDRMIRRAVQISTNTLEIKYLNLLIYFIRSTAELPLFIRQTTLSLFRDRKEEISKGGLPPDRFWIEEADKVLFLVKEFLDQSDLILPDRWKAIEFLREIASWIGPPHQAKLEKAATEAGRRALSRERKFYDSAIRYMKNISKSPEYFEATILFLEEKRIVLEEGKELSPEFTFECSKRIVQDVDHYLSEINLSASDYSDAIDLFKELYLSANSKIHQEFLSEAIHQMIRRAFLPELQFIDLAIETFHPFATLTNTIEWLELRKRQILSGKRAFPDFWFLVMEKAFIEVKNLLEQKAITPVDSSPLILFFKQMALWVETPELRLKINHLVNELRELSFESEREFLAEAIQYFRTDQKTIEKFVNLLSFLKKTKSDLDRGARRPPHFWIEIPHRIAQTAKDFFSHCSPSCGTRWAIIEFLRKLNLQVIQRENLNSLETVADGTARKALEFKNILVNQAILYLDRNPGQSPTDLEALAFFQEKRERIAQRERTSIPLWFHATNNEEKVDSILGRREILQNKAVRGYGAYVSSSDEAGTIGGYGRYTFALDSEEIDESPAAYFVPNPQNHPVNKWIFRMYGWKCASIWVRVEKSIAIHKHSLVYIVYPAKEELSHKEQRMTLQKRFPWIVFMNRNTSEKICEVIRKSCFLSLSHQWRRMEHTYPDPLPNHFMDPDDQSAVG